MAASAIDFAALTHIIHFSAEPNSNGSLNTSVNTLSSRILPASFRLLMLPVKRSSSALAGAAHRLDFRPRPAPRTSAGSSPTS